MAEHLHLDPSMVTRLLSPSKCIPAAQEALALDAKNGLILRMWIGSLLQAVVRGGLQDKTKVHFVLDESAFLGHLAALDDAVDNYRGYGVRLREKRMRVGQKGKRDAPERERTAQERDWATQKGNG